MLAFLRTLIFTVFVPGFWTVLVPYWLVRRHSRLELRATAIAGWLLVIAGVALYLTCAFWGFALRGGGTPAPIDPPKRLVVEGPYRIVRNPMYWSVATVMMGEALVLRSPALAEIGGVFFACTVLFVMVYEEPILRHKFGAEYDAYCERVPGWIPRFRNKLN
jgi:protein-S-isoprenylcysteine O-methyltransferase Ste14